MADSKRFAPDGREITEEMIGRWCEAYEKGEFPEGEHTVGGVICGQQQASQTCAACLNEAVEPAEGAAAVDE